MNTYMIGYDLLKPGQDYKDLIEAIKKLGSWWHCLDSTWIVISAQTPAQIRDYLLQYVDQNDRLLVAKISAPAAWYGFAENCSTWLSSNLK